MRRESERESKTDRQTDRQADRQADRQTRDRVLRSTTGMEHPSSNVLEHILLDADETLTLTLVVSSEQRHDRVDDQQFDGSTVLDQQLRHCFERAHHVVGVESPHVVDVLQRGLVVDPVPCKCIEMIKTASMLSVQ